MTKPASNERLPSWGVTALLLVLGLLAANYKLLVGKAFPQWDAADFFAPEFGLVADHAKAHHLLTWDPWTAGGTPDLSEPELGVTSPILLPIAVLTPNVQSEFIVYWMVIWAGGTLGMLLLARHLGATKWGALIAATGFAASGFYTGHAEHISSLYSLSWLPWIMWRFDASVTTRRLWLGVQGGALYGVSTLGGYPQFTILTGLLLAAWGFGRFCFFRAQQTDEPTNVRIGSKRVGRRLAGVSAAIIITGALGAAIASPIYLGFTAHTRGYSDRTGPRLREEALTSNPFPTAAFTTFASPYLPLLNMAPQAIWPQTDVTMSSIYCGSLILTLAAFSLTRRNAWRWWLASLCILFGCCAVGNDLPVRGWLYDFVMPTRYFRNPSLFTGYVIFLLATLAAYGARDLADSVKASERIRFFVTSVVLAGGAILAFKVLVHVAHKRLPGFRFANDHLFIVWAGVVLVALCLVQRWLSLHTASRYFVALALFDAGASLYIGQPVIDVPVTQSWWQAMNRGGRALTLPTLAREFRPSEVIGSYPNNRNIALKVATLQSYVTLKNRFYDATLADPILSATAVGNKRFCFAEEPAWVPPTNGEFSKLLERSHQLGGSALVLHTPESMQTLADFSRPQVATAVEIKSAARCMPADISELRYTPVELSFDYVAQRTGWLLVTDRWAPGWSVRVNSMRRPLVAGNFLFRAVRVNPGLNHVEFTYSPSFFWPLTIFSWTILGVIGGTELVRYGALLRGRRRTPEAALT